MVNGHIARLLISDEMGKRPPHPDRRLQSANDWYGYGWLAAMCGFQISNFEAWYYCGKRAAYEQYMIGFRHGRMHLPKTEKPLI